MLARRALVPKGTTRLYCVTKFEAMIKQDVVSYNRTHSHHRHEYAIQLYYALRQIDVVYQIKIQYVTNYVLQFYVTFRTSRDKYVL